MAAATTRVRVTTTFGKEKDYKELFRRIVLDYCKRFKVKVTKGAWDISIVIADYQGEDGSTGMTSILPDENKIVVQIQAPYFGTDIPSNPILNHTFMVVLCHEFVHCCQAMTGREGIRARVFMDEDLDDELNYAAYYFDPEEIEARILDEYYVRFVPNGLREALENHNKESG
jgi:hypothetical protein